MASSFLWKIIKKNVGSKDSHFFFSYGTLKRGEKDHTFLMNKKNGFAQFVDKGETIQKFPLIVMKKFNHPGLIPTSGHGNNVHGEIYEIDERMLTGLDKMHHHPNLYERAAILVKIPDENETAGAQVALIRCWVYFFKMYNMTPFEEDDMLIEYSQDGSKKGNGTKT